MYKKDGKWRLSLTEKAQYPDVEICEVCSKKINTMTFKGTGVCGEDHRKVRDGDGVNRYGS